MVRVRKSTTHRVKHNRVMKEVKGFRGAPGHLYRLAKEAAVNARVNARIGRKLKKRTFRAMWIVRLSAASEDRGMRYSVLIAGLKKANITVNRKMLSEIAIADPKAFDVIVDAAKAALA
jgi:large subunit ribosomal protein L20